eukprot:Protomagalhaensia_sp_Gyna_25__3457@NODE_3111_length_727_cov_2_665698_g2601_i0_p2_GENE_NODE_3111_length_727_cov_2_665698_g2601_i0NODE_3111_length_727_cov_2_665698_g2601_i0_p2_ORF_typecomplete_len117_score19_68DUF1854/PF08909_11/89DUF1854/PF08909_11/0_62_NODE_3111_length_727_cov_2_665698_g2601_i0330680
MTAIREALPPALRADLDEELRILLESHIALITATMRVSRLEKGLESEFVNSKWSGRKRQVSKRALQLTRMSPSLRKWKSLKKKKKPTIWSLQKKATRWSLKKQKPTIWSLKKTSIL